MKLPPEILEIMKAVSKIDGYEKSMIVGGVEYDISTGKVVSPNADDDDMAFCTHPVLIKVHSKQYAAFEVLSKLGYYTFSPKRYPERIVETDDDVPLNYLRFYHDPDAFNFREQRIFPEHFGDDITRAIKASERLRAKSEALGITDPFK